MALWWRILQSAHGLMRMIWYDKTYLFTVFEAMTAMTYITLACVKKKEATQMYDKTYWSR
jgi:hypothetical protein